MIQKSIKTNFERLIRCSVNHNRTLDDKYYCWQWEGDNKQWIYYATNHATELEIKYNTDKSDSFDMHLTSTLIYEINFKKMKQTNKSTKFSRNIRRIQSGKKILFIFFLFTVFMSLT